LKKVIWLAIQAVLKKMDNTNPRLACCDVLIYD
jgi:hypothetical protein